jgi:hypothetical protein
MPRRGRQGKTILCVFGITSAPSAFANDKASLLDEMS